MYLQIRFNCSSYGSDRGEGKGGENKNRVPGQEHGQKQAFAGTKKTQKDRCKDGGKTETRTRTRTKAKTKRGTKGGYREKIKRWTEFRHELFFAISEIKF